MLYEAVKDAYESGAFVGATGAGGTVEIVETRTGDPGTDADFVDADGSTPENRKYIAVVPRGEGLRIAGTYDTPDALLTDRPMGSEGDVCAVGSQNTVRLYLWDVSAGAWKDIGPISGQDGPPGVGVPPGGQDGQVLVKDGAEDYAAKWETAVTQETDPTVPAWAKAPTKPVYTKAEVGLSNVDNTSDANKPVSTATQTALNGKSPTNHASTGDEYGIATNTMKGHIASSNGTSTTDDIKAVAYQYLTAPASVDLNNYRLHGEWTLNNVTEALNFPPGTWTGTNYSSFLKVIRITSDTNMMQILWKRGTFEIWIRYGLAAASWAQWVMVQTSMTSWTNLTVNRALEFADVGKILDMNSTAARTITIPDDATTNFLIGTEIIISRANTGTVSIVPAEGVTLNSLGGLRSIAGQYGTVTLRKRNGNSWRLTGDLA